MLEDNQIYVVVDIEADGPVPGINSMLSLAAVATTADEEASSFYCKLLPLEGATQDPETMAWWRTQPIAWSEATANAERPAKVMDDFISWLQDLGKVPLFVSHPTALDYTFVSWYLWKFTDSNPFTNSQGAPAALDISSFIAGKFNRTYENSNAKRLDLPSLIGVQAPKHTHNALDDVRGCAALLRHILKAKTLQ